MSSTTPSHDSRYRLSPHSDPFSLISRQMDAHSIDGFDVTVNVKRGFTFEELQSGEYFSALDESDRQFYGMYGQPILIPCSEDFMQEDGWTLHGQSSGDSDSSFYSTTAVHYTPPQSNPCAFQITKSYTLVGSLGDLSASTSAPSGAAQIARVPATARHRDETGLKRDSGLARQPFGDLLYSSDLTSSPVQLHPRHRYAHEGTLIGLPNHVDGDVKPFDNEPPMDHLPYPPPTHSAPSHEFQPYSPTDTMTLSSSPYSPQSPTFLNTEHRDPSEAHVTVPSQSYMFIEAESPPFIHTNQQHYHSQNDSPSHTHGERAGSPCQRSPSPRSALRISPPPPPKRSLDKKPALACLFCRGRKIACGPPVPGSKDRTCNQCARRHLKCEYPLESRRGMRKRRSLVPRASGSPPPEINSSGPKVTKSGRKRSVDKCP